VQAYSFGFTPLLSLKSQSENYFHEVAEYLVQGSAYSSIGSSLSFPQQGSRNFTFEWLCDQGAGMNFSTNMLSFSCHLLQNL